MTEFLPSRFMSAVRRDVLTLIGADNVQTMTLPDVEKADEPVRQVQGPSFPLGAVVRGREAKLFAGE
jgi:hypothetical protein